MAFFVWSYHWEIHCELLPLFLLPNILWEQGFTWKTFKHAAFLAIWLDSKHQNLFQNFISKPGSNVFPRCYNRVYQTSKVSPKNVFLSLKGPMPKGGCLVCWKAMPGAQRPSRENPSLVTHDKKYGLRRKKHKKNRPNKTTPEYVYLEKGRATCRGKFKCLLWSMKHNSYILIVYFIIIFVLTLVLHLNKFTLNGNYFLI